MNEAELTLYRLQVRIEVRDYLLQALLKTLRALPGAEQPLLAWASQVRAQSALQTVSGVTAAYSDLAAAEYQEALRELFDGLGL